MILFEGKELKTFGDISSMMRIIYEAKDEQRAAEFMKCLRANDRHADGNVGYMAGYFDQETANGMLKIFKVKHPFFGTKMPNSAAEAYELGLKAGESK